MNCEWIMIWNVIVAYFKDILCEETAIKHKTARNVADIRTGFFRSCTQRPCDDEGFPWRHVTPSSTFPLCSHAAGLCIGFSYPNFRGSCVHFTLIRFPVTRFVLQTPPSQVVMERWALSLSPPHPNTHTHPEN